MTIKTLDQHEIEQVVGGILPEGPSGLGNGTAAFHGGNIFPGQARGQSATDQTFPGLGTTTAAITQINH